MNTHKLSNVPLADYRLFLSKAGCRAVSIEGGHEKWTKPGLLRPIIVQTHVDPVPEFIIKNALRTLGLTKKDFFMILFCE
ncbi:MAG: type II toxin-antitoxin system HicA family toxin [Muribaculaceae bacterium]|nr:type II toxin-antitoxin system HicA family toxin [Muribaculaceae bacterium]